jgi:RNA chaperone Hfq
MQNNKSLGEFLRSVKNKRKKVNLFLTSGIKLVGFVHSFDDRSIVLRGDSDMLVMLSAVSTVVPASPSIFMGANGRDLDLTEDDDDGYVA